MAQDQNSDAVYYGTVKTRNLVISCPKQKTQEVKLKQGKISPKLDYFHSKSYHISLLAKEIFQPHFALHNVILL